jgi:valyl-tRNA synthetase
VRDLRIKHGIKNTTIIQLNLISKTLVDIKFLNVYLKKLNIKISKKLSLVSSSDQIENFSNFSVQILNEFEDKNKKLESLKNEHSRLKNEIERSTKILSNQNFLSKASKDKISVEKQKFEEYKKQYQDIEEIIKNMSE